MTFFQNWYFNTTFFFLSFQGGTKGKKTQKPKKAEKVQPNVLIGLFVHFPKGGVLRIYVLGCCTDCENNSYNPDQGSQGGNNTTNQISGLKRPLQGTPGAQHSPEGLHKVNSDSFKHLVQHPNTLGCKMFAHAKRQLETRIIIKISTQPC